MPLSHLHVSRWLSPPPVFRSPWGRKLLIIVPHQIHLCPLGHQPATNGRGVETAGWKITIAHRAGQWKSFPLDFFAGGGRLATAQTQSLALSSAYSKALTPLSTLHIKAPGRQRRVEWSRAERVALNLDFLFPGTSLLWGTSPVRWWCLSKCPTLKWGSGAGWWWNRKSSRGGGETSCMVINTRVDKRQIRWTWVKDLIFNLFSKKNKTKQFTYLHIYAVNN